MKKIKNFFLSQQYCPRRAPGEFTGRPARGIEPAVIYFKQNPLIHVLHQFIDILNNSAGNEFFIIAATKKMNRWK